MRSFRDIAPEGLYDLHSHLLPGLDDGAADLEESHVMLRRFKELGYVTVVATPHFDNSSLMPSVSIQKELITQLSSIREDTVPELLTGAEIIFDDVFFENEKQRNLPQIGKGRVYLIEFSFSPGTIPLHVEDFAFRFRVKGGTLILSHPERFSDFQRDPERLALLSRAGVLLQIDLMSLAGKYGRKAKRMASTLLEEGKADLVSSDLHHPGELRGLGESLRELAELGEEEFVRLTSLNPRLILEGRLDEVVRDV